MTEPTLHCPCKRQFEARTFDYDSPPEGETIFDLGDQTYRRGYNACQVCGHWFSDNPMDLSELYSGAYVDTTYGDRMRATFDRILALPIGASDNAGRVERVLGFSTGWFGCGTVPNLLDVGSGLGVFPYRMKEAGWRCTALDPDVRAGEHARNVVGVSAVVGDFLSISQDLIGSFDVITFNKVLEHVADPAAMLRKAADHLAEGGFVYIEVPDVAASAEGSGREEFFIEHLHVFSPASLAMLAERSGFSPITIERLREPSTKFTIRAFLSRHGML